MRAQFGYVFWGLIFVLLHFKINGFDLLPDIIGFGLIAIGASNLAVLSQQFRLASSLSIVLAILWAIGLAISGDAGILFGVLVTILNCAMMWSLLGGIIDFTTSRDRRDLAELAQKYRVFYVGFMAGMYILVIVARGSGALGGLIAIAAIVVMITLLVLIMRLVHRVRYEVAQE
jgi:hypothetical protein